MTLLDSTFRKHLHDNISRFPNKKELSHHTLRCSETAPLNGLFLLVLIAYAGRFPSCKGILDLQRLCRGHPRAGLWLSRGRPVQSGC